VLHRCSSTASLVLQWAAKAGPVRPFLVSWFALAVIAAACSSRTAPITPERRATPLARMRAGTPDEARAVLARSDGFTEQMSPADRSFRLKQPLPVSQAALLAFAAAQARAFTPAELARLDRARAVLEAGLARRGLALEPFLPAEVLIIKTTGDEEYGMPYTRQHAIVMPSGVLSRITDDVLPRVIAHELWHVVSRHSPALRDAAYAVIGTTTAAGFTMPPEVAARTITNPDGPDVAFRVPVQLATGAAWVMALLNYRSPGFTAGGSGNIMDLIELRFLELAQDASGAWQPARDGSGALVTHQPDATAFAPCYGQNTDAIAHPDEVVAQSFALLALGDFPARPEVTTPALLDDLATVIADGARRVPEVRCRY
jgi:Zn-dependent protease with chaperone function